MKQVVLPFLALAVGLIAGSAGANCITDTSQADWQAGLPSNVNLIASPGDVVLATTGGGGSSIDQQNTSITANGELFTNNQWVAQTFTAGKSGSLVRVDVNLFCVFCSTAPPAITVSIRGTTNGLPSGADLASTSVTMADFSGSQVYYAANFGSPTNVTSGVQYAIVIRATAAYGTGRNLGFSDSAVSGSTGNDVYAGGALAFSTTAGSSWAIETGPKPSVDGGFRTYIGSAPTYVSSGTETSSLKDSAPPTGSTPTWTTLSWNNGLPANTSVKLQAAASNTNTGPFNFVGPDGTANTYFTSGASLAQFNGNRYLKYRASLATSDASTTPALNDVMVCFSSSTPTADLSITNNDGVTSAIAGGSVTYTIVAANSGPSSVTGATVADTFPSTLTCSWTCGGAGGGSCPAPGSGNINAAVNLPVGGSATFTATCSISAAATGTLTNTATIAAPSGVSDANTANNTASDSDSLSAAPSLRITVSDNTDIVRVGDVVNYVIEVANGAGTNSATVTVTDALPAQLDSGSWVCTASTGASCSAGNSGNTLSDSATLSPGSKVDYVYTATVISADRTGMVSNAASLKTTGGAAPTQNMSATDTDAVVIFASSFEGATTQALPPPGTTPSSSAASAATTASVTAQLGVDGGLLTQLGVAPVTVATARSASGEKLFSLDLMRAGHDVLMRSQTPVDGSAFSDVSPWHVVDLKQLRLGFEWRAATSRGDDGLLRAGSAAQAVTLAASSSRALPARLDVAVVDEVPWLVLVEP